jgi:hypothetical protein
MCIVFCVTDYVAGVGFLEDMLEEVDLHCILMVGHLVMVEMQNSKIPLVQPVTEHINVPCQFLGPLPQQLCALSQL